jgi:hypothetical protein
MDHHKPTDETFHGYQHLLSWSQSFRSCPERVIGSIRLNCVSRQHLSGVINHFTRSPERFRDRFCDDFFVWVWSGPFNTAPNHSKSVLMAMRIDWTSQSKTRVLRLLNGDRWVPRFIWKSIRSKLMWWISPDRCDHIIHSFIHSSENLDLSTTVIFDHINPSSWS